MEVHLKERGISTIKTLLGEKDMFTVLDESFLCRYFTK